MIQAGSGWLRRLDYLASSIDDPCCPLAGPEPHEQAEVGRRWINQRNRRAHIFSSARQIVAESGLDAVHMAAVAERSGVSVQTVYNVVGGRHELLGAAASEWIGAIARRAKQIGQGGNANVTFTMIELFWAAAVLQRQYSVNLIRAQAGSILLEEPFVKMTTDLLHEQLRELQSHGALVRWASPRMLSWQLATASHECVRNWLNRPYDETLFAERLVTGCGLLLRGALQGPEMAKVERGMDMH